jgi:lactoylglutathione lyase
VGAADATLRARSLPAGCKATSPVKTGVNRKRQVNCFDPDGTRVEIMESHTVDGMPATSSPAPAPRADAQG